MLVGILSKLAGIRQTVRITASFVLSLALLGYMLSPLPGGYLAAALILLVLYVNLVLMRLSQAAATTEEVTRAVEEAQTRWEENLAADRAAWQDALSLERSERIVGFAGRDSSGELPGHCVMIVAVPRSGSTWLMDALRAHPAVYLEPGAIVYQELGLQGNRYPRGLSDGADGTLDLELTRGSGVRVPEFSLGDTASRLPNGGVRSYAVEKIHPAFFDFDPDTFLARVDQLHQRAGMTITFVYQMRDPRAALTSFLAYKRRDPSWYPRLPEDEVPSLMERTYAVVLRLAQRRDGLVVDYDDLASEPRQTLASVYRYLWPDLGHSILEDMAGAALEVTARDSRVAAHKTPFLGRKPGRGRGDGEDLTSFFELHAEEIAQCYESYQALTEIDTSSAR